LKKNDEDFIDDGIGTVFLERAKNFKFYAAYSCNHISIGEKIKTFKARYPGFKEFLEVVIFSSSFHIIIYISISLSLSLVVPLLILRNANTYRNVDNRICPRF